MRISPVFFVLLLGFSLVGCVRQDDTTTRLVNVSYDPTRELYKEFNRAFVEYYKKETGKNVKIEVSHGGSSAQARAVIEGVEADVVTLALAYDIDHIANAGLLRTDWQQQFDHNSTPYSSTVVFLVRKGNPKNIKGWEDIIKPDVGVVVAHPKTSGVARWAYLAGWGYVLKRELGDLKKLNDPSAATEVAAAQAKAKEFITALYKNAVSLQKGARDASIAFVNQKQGDVLLDWENQAKLTINQEDIIGEYVIVVPSVSILAEPPVAIVDKNVDKRGTREVAEAYLKFLYSKKGQELVAQHFYRPRDEEILKKYPENFIDVEMFTIDDVFGGWHKAQQEHFENGGVFDQIYAPSK
jgi:sulfate transport system substrate-binding protein